MNLPLPRKDSGDFLIEWIDHKDNEAVNFQEIEIKISTINQLITDAQWHPHMMARVLGNIAICWLQFTSTWLTTGIIMFQGSVYKSWSEKEFPVLLRNKKKRNHKVFGHSTNVPSWCCWLWHQWPSFCHHWGCPTRPTRLSKRMHHTLSTWEV